MLIVLGLLAVGAVAVLVGLNDGKTSALRIAAGATADQRLIIARDALLGFAVGNISDAGTPGQLLAPDTLQDGNYDGNANNFGCLDGTAVNGLPALSIEHVNRRCLGKLPWKTLGITSDGVDENDSTGTIPWYAVSANLAASNCLTYVNPTTIAAAPVAFGCPSNTAPAYPWLKVCDQTGRLLSDRVAFVLIVPGAPIATTGRTQLRTGSPRPQPSDYLDAIPFPTGWAALSPAQRCTTYDNAALSNEFVTADTTAGFNDRLLYVTVDELMARVETRVAQQVREAMVTYEAAYGRYPWLAPVGNPTSIPAAFLTVSGTNSGLVPFHTKAGGERFMTEMNWTIGTIVGSDTVTAGTTSSPIFLCFAGAYQCRLRTSPGGITPQSITPALFQDFKTWPVATPSIACFFSTLTPPLNHLNCDPYTFTQTQAVVSYILQRRVCCSGGYSTYGTYSGTPTRNLMIALTGIQHSSGNAPTSPDASNFVRRSLTTASMSTFHMLEARDFWVPTVGAGTAPFDIQSSLQTGFVYANGSGVVNVSNVRVYPQLPTWYTAHKWNEFIYAAISSDASPSIGGHGCSTNCFSAGTRGGLNAVVISSGKQIGAQNRYVATPAITDFLEAPNSTGTATRSFADTSASQSTTYADTVVTIPN